MNGVNRVTLIGNLGGDPELRSTPGGTAVATMNVATSESWKDKSGEKQERTDWHRVEVWGKMAENCNQYLSKGSKVYVEGSIRYEKYPDKATGEIKYATKIRADDVRFLSVSGAKQEKAPPQAPTQHNLTDDIPF